MLLALSSVTREGSLAPSLFYSSICIVFSVSVEAVRRQLGYTWIATIRTKGHSDHLLDLQHFYGV